jgi:hypothetical protein
MANRTEQKQIDKLSNRQESVRVWILCERYFHWDGEPAHWTIVPGVCPAVRSEHLASFERASTGLEVTERRVIQFTARGLDFC